MQLVHDPDPAGLQHQARCTDTTIVLVLAAYTTQRCHRSGWTVRETENQADFQCILRGHAET